MIIFEVGQEVVRTKGGYVVGRIGSVVAVDLTKNRAQVNCGIKTWISFSSLALTSVPHEIIYARGKDPKYLRL